MGKTSTTVRTRNFTTATAMLRQQQLEARRTKPVMHDPGKEAYRFDCAECKRPIVVMDVDDYNTISKEPPRVGDIIACDKCGRGNLVDQVNGYKVKVQGVDLEKDMIWTP